MIKKFKNLVFFIENYDYITTTCQLTLRKNPLSLEIFSHSEKYIAEQRGNWQHAEIATDKTEQVTSGIQTEFRKCWDMF